MNFHYTVYPPGGMLEMSNGYPPSASPLGGSPSPGPSPSLGVSKGNPSRHSPQPPPPPHPHRGALRVVIPTPLGQSLAEDPSYDVSIQRIIIIYIFLRGQCFYSTIDTVERTRTIVAEHAGGSAADALDTTELHQLRPDGLLDGSQQSRLVSSEVR